MSKEQLYVRPSRNVSPTSLPGGIKPEAVETAAPLTVIIKQVLIIQYTPLCVFLVWVWLVGSQLCTVEPLYKDTPELRTPL